MKIKQFKALIKESVREVLIEDGVLTKIISEVVQGLNSQQQLVSDSREKITETQQETAQKERVSKERQRMSESRKRMLDAIGNSTRGVNIFEGTEALSKGGTPDQETTPSSALAGVSPNDPGVDISSFMKNANAWKQIIK